jgi:hypothetical protein
MLGYQKRPYSSSFKVRRNPVCPEGGTDLSEILPADLGCTKEAKDVIVDCCVGVSYLWSLVREF